MCVCVSVHQTSGRTERLCPCTLHHRHSLGVLAALVCTREDSMQQKAKNSGHVTLNGHADKICVCAVCVGSFSADLVSIN